MKITVGQVTDKGLNPKRLSNEDNLLTLPDRGLFIVADGVGGRLGGARASQLAVDVFSKIFAQRHQEDLRKVVEGAIDLCNQKIYEEALSDPNFNGMATTIAMVAVEASRAIVAHVGDSRVYRFDRKGLICLTEDHSEVSEALRAGLITAEQAARHPRRNVISRALGAEIEVEPDFREIEIDDRTSFMLCSDGVTRHVTDDEISRLMKNGHRPQEICERLKSLCYQGGAEDNLTAIVVDFGSRPYFEEATKPRVPAQARIAASGQVGGAPRQASKIEVNLNSQTESLPGATQLEASQPEARRSKKPISRGLKTQDDETPLEGEMSKLMKMSLLFITLIIGMVSGAILYRYTPLPEIVNNWLPPIAPSDRERQKDPEIVSAFALHQEGRSEEARSRINAALTVNPANAQALYYLGRIDLDQKKHDEAVNRLKKAGELDAKLPDVWAHLAAAYLELGQTRNAQDVLKKVSEQPSGPPGASPQSSP